MFGRARRISKDNIKMDLRDVCGEDGKWMELTVMARFGIISVERSGSATDII
jgi:hypothetical protein